MKIRRSPSFFNTLEVLVLFYVSDFHLHFCGHFLVAGWAFADSVLHRLAPLWVGARGLEFTWDYILQGLEANANLVFYYFHV